jgi:hypothetical protein
VLSAAPVPGDSPNCLLRRLLREGRWLRACPLNGRPHLWPEPRLHLPGGKKGTKCHRQGVTVRCCSEQHGKPLMSGGCAEKALWQTVVGAGKVMAAQRRRLKVFVEDAQHTSWGMPASWGSKVAAASRRPSATPPRSVGGSMHTGEMLQQQGSGLGSAGRSADAGFWHALLSGVAHSGARHKPTNHILIAAIHNAHIMYHQIRLHKRQRLPEAW